MGLVGTVLGEFRWLPPAWVQRVGKRRLGWILLGLVVAAAIGVGGSLYYRSLPKPLRVVIDVEPPGLSAVVDDEPASRTSDRQVKDTLTASKLDSSDNVARRLVPEPLRLDLRYALDADTPEPPSLSALSALSAARIDLVGETLEEGVLLEPAMPGEWRFESENRLVFTPDEDWPAGRDYRVRLSREVFAPGIVLATREVEFATRAFVASITDASFYQHPETVSDRRVVASFEFSHPVSRADFEQRLGMSMREGSTDDPTVRVLETRVEYGPFDRAAHVHSEILAIPERENFVTVALATDLTPAVGDGGFDESLSVQVRVPDRATYFRVEGIHAAIVRTADETPEQTAVVTFTDQVNTDDFATHVRAWLLPEEHTIGNVRHTRFAWRSPRQVTPAVLAMSELLQLNVNPAERDTASLQSVTFDVPTERFVYFRVAAGLTSKGDFVLASPYDEVVPAPDYPKEAAIAQDGAVLPLTGNRLLSLSGRGVDALKVEIQQLLPGTLNHLASQSGGDIRDPWFRYRFDADNLSVLTTRIVHLNPEHPRERVFATLDLAPFLDAGGLFFVKVQGWDLEKERVVGSYDRRMALVSDLGLLVKTNADKSQHVFVHSIATGKPVAGARVELLGKNGLPVLSAATDANGHAELASASDFERGREPTVVVVHHDGDVAFVPYDRSDRRLTLTGFDVGGEYAPADDAERLKAALYTDRGLYRPGETARLVGIVRRGDFGAVPGAPVELRIADARGSVALRRRTRLPDDGLATWAFETQPESPTGRYEAGLYLVEEHGRLRRLGGVSFDIEDYQPDRLRIRAAIVEQTTGTETEPETREMQDRGWLRPGSHFARVTLENLFGTPAQRRRVRGTLELRPMSPRFAEHPEFVFTDPFRDPDAPPRTVTLELAEMLTDGDGAAHLPFDLGKYTNGIYRLLLTAEGFESGGGRGVKAMTATLMSPADALVGYKADGDLDFIALDGERTVHFLALDRDLAPVAMAGLNAVLFERRYVSALVKRPNGTYGYQSVVKETELARDAVALSADGLARPLPTGRPGRYALELLAADGTKLTRVEFTVAGAANVAGNLERNAELDLKLDRREYAPGDEVTLEITAPYAGTGLVTIERDRVYAFEWFHSQTNTAVARIRVPENLEGNAYVNVAFVRDIDSEEIFVSPLSYAAAPFSIDRVGRRLDIDLAAPTRTRPGGSLALTYATSEPSRVVLFAVDEGILQVAKYATPDPLERFLAKQGLGVVTHQMVDLILPDYEVVRRAAAPGGGDLAHLLGANLNPFRRRSEPPVVYWAGVREADREPREAVFEVPDYFNGEIRVMAIAVGDSKLGSRAVPVTVRGPIVLTPNLPLAVAPNDTFEVSVGIANNIEGSGPDAEVTVAAVDLRRLSSEGEAVGSLAVGEGGEGRATWRLRAGVSPGEASFGLEARLGETTVQRGASLSVRPAVPFATTVRSGFDADGDSRIDVPRQLHEAFADRRFAASRSPLVLADGLIEYLATFPHACAEQIVSKVFPQLGLLRSPGFGLDRVAFARQFRDTVTKLRGRQNADGGFRFWVTSLETAPFPSVYVSHFLTDARELGMAVPDDMVRSTGSYLQRIAGAPSGGDLATHRTRAYAIYLLTRRGSVTTNYLNALQQAMQDGFGDAWRSDMASAYLAASHELLRNDILADGLIDGYRLGESSSLETDFDTQLGRDAQYVYLLARHFPDRMARLDGASVRRLVEPVFEDRFNTLSAAYLILALGQIHRNLEQQGALEPPEVNVLGPDGPIDVAVTGGPFARLELPVTANRVEIAGLGHGVYYTASESGFDVEVPHERLAEGIEVDRAYLDDDDEPVSRVRLGDEITVRLRVRSQRGRIRNVAVTDLLPGGFEIVTDSVRDRFGRWSSDYRDVREDRLVLYGSFGENLTEIRYRVKATSPGDFAAPAAHAAAMYHRSVRGRSVAGRLIVDGT